MEKRKQVLLVDDHAETRVIMARLLSMAGFDVTAAAGKTEALRQCRTTHFNVLISDLLLSDGHGLDLLQEIQGIYPIRAIACSGMGDEERDKCLAGGFDAYFCKPIDIKHLLKSLAEPPEMPSFFVPCTPCGQRTIIV